MVKINKLLLFILSFIFTCLFAYQLFTDNTPSVGESIKTLIYAIPAIFVWGGSHAPIRRKYLLLLAVSITILFSNNPMKYLQMWYITAPFIGLFIYYIGRGYSDTVFLANEGRPKSVSLNEADTEDTKTIIPYLSRPTFLTKKKSMLRYLAGYFEVGLTGIGYGIICSPLCFVSGQSFWYSFGYGALIGFTLSILGFLLHKIQFKNLDTWGIWEMASGISVAMSLIFSIKI